MRLRSHLLVLSIATAAPVAALAVVIAMLVVRQERETLKDAAGDRVAAVMSAVDAEVKGSIDTLRALAASSHLESGDLHAFHAEARRILATHPDWLDFTLARPDGTRIANAANPPGAELGPVVDRESFDLAVRSGEAVVGSVALGPDGRNYAIPLRLPVLYGEGVKYVLTAVLKPESFAELLRAQRLPEGWVAGIADRNRKLIARVPPLEPGQPIAPSFRAALERSPQGWFHGRTLEGRETYTPYVSSSVSGWALGIAMPAQVVDAAAWRTLWLLAAMVLLAAGIAVGLAVLLGRRIARPIAALASATEAFARGETARVPEAGRVAEVGVLARALQRSIEAVREREEALKRAEERTRSIVNHVLDGIITIDERGTVESFNLAAERLFGFAASEVVGHNVKMLMPEPYRDEHDGYLGNYLRTGEAKIIGIGREVEGRRKDGATFPMELAVSEFRIDGRRFFTGIVRDITERKHAEQELKQASRAKDEFLAMLSHELRNPLAALTTAAHVLKLANPSDAAAIKARAVVERQTKHMAHLVGDLLDISRVAMGKVTLERERFDLADAVAGVLTVWRASGRLERHRVWLDVEPAWVDADRARIEQIISNLLDNAVKFTPAGKRVSVSLWQRGESAVLVVADEGEGLAPGAAARIFNLFVQGERGLDRGGGGLGIGLALVKRLTEMHGGSVSAASPGPGRGATFTVTLPAVQPLAQQPAREPAGPPGAPRRVLIIEDSEDTRQMLREALALSGHQVTEAQDGESGLALAAEAWPDVALIDIGLPDVDGYEVARRLRAAPGGRRVGLIAITGYGQDEDHRRAYEAGFDAHLTKPVAPERLKQVISGFG